MSLLGMHACTKHKHDVRHVPDRFFFCLRFLVACIVDPITTAFPSFLGCSIFVDGSSIAHLPCSVLFFLRFCRGRVGDGWRPPRVRFSTTGWTSFYPRVLGWMAQDGVLHGGENERMTSDQGSFPATSPPGGNQLIAPPTPSWWNATPHA